MVIGFQVHSWVDGTIKKDLKPANYWSMVSPSLSIYLHLHSEVDLSFSLPVSVSSHFLVILHSLTPFSHCLSFTVLPLLSLFLLCAAVAGCPGVRGPGGGSGVQGPWKFSSAGQMVPPGRGDHGLPRFSYSPEKWDILLSGHEAHYIWIILFLYF